MKYLLAAVPVAALFGVTAASADTLILKPEQETAVHTYILKHRGKAVKLPSDVQISVGSALPDTIELEQMDVPDVQYRYVVVGDKTLLVDPETHKIVEIYE